MAEKTDVQLSAQAAVIRDETLSKKNTALRVGTLFQDIIDSKLNSKTFVYEIWFPSAVAISILLENTSTLTDAILGGGIASLEYSNDSLSYTPVVVPVVLSAGVWYFKPNTRGNIILKGTY